MYRKLGIAWLSGALAIASTLSFAMDFDLVGPSGVMTTRPAKMSSGRLEALVDAQRSHRSQIVAANEAAMSASRPQLVDIEEANPEEENEVERMRRLAHKTPSTTTFETAAASRHYSKDESKQGKTLAPGSSPETGNTPAANGSTQWDLVSSVIANPDGTPKAMGAVKALRYAYDNIDQRTTMYAGALNGGLWKQRLLFLFPYWELISGNLPGSPSVGAFWVNPADSHVLLVGTGAYGRASGTGLYKSVDAGSTWTRIQMGDVNTIQPSAFLHLENDQFNALTLYACTDSGLWVSSDQGSNWVNRRANQCSDFIQLDFFGGTLLVVADYGGNIVYGAGDGNWTVADSSGIVGQRGRISLAMSPSSTGTVFALVASPANGAEDFLGVYRSSNYGLSGWSNISGSLNLGKVMGFHANAIRVDPDDPNVLAVGMVKMALTTNANAVAPTWTPVSTGLSDHSDFQFVPQALQPRSTKVVIANDGGIYVYDWSASTMSYQENNRGMNVELVMSNTDTMTHSRANPNLLAAGLWDTGDVLIDFGSSATSNRITYITGGDGGAMALSPDSELDMVGTSGANWHRVVSRDRGKTWASMDSGCSNMDSPMTAAWAITFDQTTGYGANAYTFSRTAGTAASVYGVYQTSINSPSCSWTKLHNGNLSSNFDRSSVNVSVSLANNDRANIIYVAASDRSEVAVLTDIPPMTISDRTPSAVGFAYSTWTSLSADRHPEQAETVYYTSRDPYGTLSLLMLSWDAGITWQNVTGNINTVLPGVTANELIADPQNLDHLFLATDTGVYRSFNRGATWLDYSEGLPVAAAVTQLEIDSDSSPRRLLLGSYGFGFYSRNMDFADTIFMNSFEN